MTCSPWRPRLQVSSVQGLVLFRPLVILPQGEPVEARVGAAMVVVVTPCRDQVADMALVGEQMLVKALGLMHQRHQAFQAL